MEGFKQDLQVNGVDTVVYGGGKGEPLLFLHGGGTFHGFEFAESLGGQVPRHPSLSSGLWQVGRRSGDERVAGLCHALCRASRPIGIDKVILVGFSLGGWIAARFAIAYPNRVKKLALVGPAGFRDKEHPTADILACRARRSPACSFRTSTSQEMAAGKAGHGFHARALPRIDDLRAALLGAPWDRELSALSPPGHHADADRLGRRGQDRSSGAAQALAEIPSEGRHQDFPGAGHLVLDEKPEAAKAVGSFLAP